MKAKKFLAIMLAFVLIISTAMSVSAASITDDSGSELSEITLKAYEEKELNVSVFTGSENVAITPLSIPSAGRVTIDAQAIELPDSASIEIVKTETADKNSYVDQRIFLSNSGATNMKSIKISEKGDYFLRVTTSDHVSEYTPSRENIVALSLKFTPASATLTSKKASLAAGLGSSAYNYFKLIVAKDSYVDLELKPSDENTYPSGFNVKLYNSKKKAYTSSPEYLSSSDVNKKLGFALKKGTYYIAVATGNELFTIKPTVTAVTKTSGTSKSKATTLAKNKAKSGIVAIYDKDEQWYKLTVPKNQKVSLTLSGNVGFGSIKATLYNAKNTSSYAGVSVSISDYKDSEVMLPYTYGIKGGALEKGTYYVKIERSYGTGTGKYTVKWN